MKRICIPARALICCCALGLPLACSAADHTPPLLMRAAAYDRDAAIDLADYWVSEKLDGVRAYWDGRRLLTRAGNVIVAPEWFTAGWPATPLDGELWGGRGRFAWTSGVVRRELPDERDWQALRFMAFDLPAHPGVFDERRRELGSIVQSTNVPQLRAIEQFRVQDRRALDAKLAHIESLGGEGLMLHRGASRYSNARGEDLLKYKSYQDAEARVVGHVPGNGKYTGAMGALLVERADGVRFRIGSGFTDAERQRPPPLGSWITYAYNGLTDAGLPRFARYIGIREDIELPTP